MATYNVDWQSKNLESLIAKQLIVLPPKTINTSSSSLALTGEGVKNYGEIQQENFLHLLEHFASQNPPQNGTIGQIWFNTAEAVLYLCADPTMAPTAPAFYPQGNGLAWFKVWSLVSGQIGGGAGGAEFAGLNEYSIMAADINRVIGLSSTSGSDTEAALNHWGWGQSDLVPEYVDATTLKAGFSPSVYPPTFSNEAWVILLSRLRKALRHIGLSESLPSNVGFIDDGRPTAPGNSLANTYNSYPSPGTLVNYSAGFGGNGLVSIPTLFANTQNAISALKTNRFNMAAASAESSRIVTFSRVVDWNTTRTHTITMSFPNRAAAEHYFNAGGSMRFVWSHTPSTPDAFNLSWKNLLAAQSDLVFDMRGVRRGANYELFAGVSRGFYDLTTTATTIFEKARNGGSYGGNLGDGGIRVQARTSQTAVFNVIFDVSFVENALPGEVVQGSTVSELWCHKANNVNTNTPGISYPSGTSSGTFTT